MTADSCHSSIREKLALTGIRTYFSEGAMDPREKRVVIRPGGTGTMINHFYTRMPEKVAFIR
jgi:hypothetical protein